MHLNEKFRALASLNFILAIKSVKKKFQKFGSDVTGKWNYPQISLLHHGSNSKTQWDVLPQNFRGFE